MKIIDGKLTLRCEDGTELKADITDAQIERAEALGINLSAYALIPGVNDLATINPELAVQWHPEKNGDLKPAEVTTGSNKKVWWRHRMPDGTWHEWEAAIVKRTRESHGCPFCSRRARKGFKLALC